jgi:hypothetical protein
MRQRLFPYLIALAAFLVSGSAAFYSVYGIGKMFAGASFQVMVMAGSLEFAKIVIASLLHQYWKSINRFLRIYFMIAVFILIGITSAGIYGFLSSAYQETAFKLENGRQSIELIEGDKKILSAEIESINKQIEDKTKRISSLSEIRTKQQGTQDNLISTNKSTKSINTQIAGVESNIKSLDVELRMLNDSLSSKNRQIATKDVEIMKINSNKDIAQEIGPIKYISEITGKPLGTVVNWYIIALMLVFDPLAIALVIAANFAFSQVYGGKNEDNEEIDDHTMGNAEPAKEPDAEETIEIVEESVEKKKEKITEEATVGESGPIPIEDISFQENEEIIASPEIHTESSDSVDLTVATSTKNPGEFSGYKSQDKESEPFRDPTRIK